MRPEEAYIRRRTLHQANVGIAWLKFFSVFCYGVLYFLTSEFSTGAVSKILKTMIIIIVPLQIINGGLLILGAVKEKPVALVLALWLIIFLATYNTVLGLLGAIYFIRVGSQAVHFVLSLIYALMALSIITVMCHDVIVIYTLKILIDPPSQTTGGSQEPRVQENRNITFEPARENK